MVLIFKNKRVRGVRASIPSGYVLGRMSKGTGPAEMVPLGLAQAPGGIVPTGVPRGNAGGDLSGTYPNPIVSGIQGQTVTGTIPNANDILQFTSGSWGPLSLSLAIDNALGSARGDILYRGASGWTVLAPGTAGWFLETQGAGADPVWAAAGGGSLPSIADGDTLANTSGGVAAPIATTLSAWFDYVLGSAQGDIIYRDASVWKVLAPGVAGSQLQSGGAGANPSWVTNALPANFHPGYVTGRFYTRPFANGLSVAGISTGTMYAMPFYVAATTTFTKLMVAVTTAVAASTIRVGIYNNSGGQPSSLVLDAGTISAAATGDISATISQALNPGWYWLVMTPSVNGISVRVSTAGTDQTWMFGTTTSNGNQTGFQVTFTFGALPGTFPGGGTYGSSTFPVLWIAP